MGRSEREYRWLHLPVGTLVSVYLCSFAPVHPCTFAPLLLQAEHKAEVTRELSRSEEKWGQRVREVEEEGRWGTVLHIGNSLLA